MTTPSEEAVTRLAGALRAFDETGGIWHGWAADGDTKYTATGFATALLDADPQLAAAIELGLAWAEVRTLAADRIIALRNHSGQLIRASAYDPESGVEDHIDAGSEVAALRALAARLR